MSSTRLGSDQPTIQFDVGHFYGICFCYT